MISTKSVNVKPPVSVSSGHPAPSMFWKWLSYIRSPIASVISLLWTAVGAVYIILASAFLGPAHLHVQSVFRNWAYFVLWLFNIRVHVQGTEHLPREGVLFLFNHASHFDIPVLCSAIPKVSRFGAKIELFKIPFLAPAMRATGVLPIARGQREEVMRVYQQSIPRIKKGESFILAPEGTRQTVHELGRFKTGPFIFAIEAQAPLVPVVIEGALEIMPRNTLKPMWGLWRHQVQVRFLEPVPTAGCTLEQMPELQERVRNQMAAAYQSLREVSSRQR